MAQMSGAPVFSFIPALFLFLFPLAYSPGPGNLFFAANGARFGFRATLPANAGYHAATWLVTMAMGFGVLSVIDRFPPLFTGLKVTGALYVFWLAIGMMRAGSRKGTPEGRPAGFVDGVLLLVLNPKAYVIMGLMFSQFLNPLDPDRAARILMIASAFTLNNLMAFSLWTWAGDRLARQFRSDTGAKWLNLGFGGLLGAVAVWMLMS